MNVDDLQEKRASLMTQREALLAAALGAIRGSDPWPGLDATKLGGASNGRYKSEIARVVLVGESERPLMHFRAGSDEEAFLDD